MKSMPPITVGVGKKAWKPIVWQILEDRLRENSLSKRKFEVQQVVAPEEDTANAAASSSSAAATWLEGDSDLNKKRPARSRALNSRSPHL